MLEVRRRASVDGDYGPQTAARLKVIDGGPMAVKTRRGSVEVTARVTRDIRPDTVFMPFHWPGDGMANAVTNDATDPISGMPEFKVCAVSIARADLFVPTGEGVLV